MDPEHVGATYGYLTTTGRRTGNPHTVEIWFAVHDGTVYLLSGSGGRSDWAHNLRANPNVTFGVEGTEYRGTARPVTDPEEDAAAREVVVAKYQPRYGGDLAEWRARSAPFAVDLHR